MKRPFDGKALGEQIVSFVRAFVSKHVDVLKERIDGIESMVRAIPAPLKGDPGESIKGDPGADGKDGSLIYSGEGAPDASLGKSGDHYIDLLTGDVYRCD